MDSVIISGDNNVVNKTLNQTIIQKFFNIFKSDSETLEQRNGRILFILTHNNIILWRLVPFLDHCVDLIFLRRVGGGYIFVHRLLMELYTDMYEASQP